MAVSLEVAEYETLIFWEQVDPQDEYEPTFECPVCGTTSDWEGCCSRDCYQAWVGSFDDDPMDYDRF